MSIKAMKLCISGLAVLVGFFSSSCKAEVINLICTTNSNVSTSIYVNTERNIVRMGNTPIYNVQINDLSIRFVASFDGVEAEHVIDRGSGGLRVYSKYGLVFEGSCRKGSRKF